MENKIFNRKNKIIIGVLIIFVGICLLSSNYFNLKKQEVFDDMNELYYEQIVRMDEEVEIIDEEEPISEQPITTIPVEENHSTTTTTTTTTKKKVVIDYTKYYVGYLSIPKIDFKKGFTEINNKYNNVNRNIYVLPESDYPNVVNGNFIIAGHSGSSSVSFFKNLYKLSIDDDIIVTYGNKDYKYKIKNIYLEQKDGDIAIKRNKNKTTLTLVTCTKGDNKTQTIYICELED